MRFLLLLFLALPLVANAALLVAVSVPPQKTFVKAVGGDAVSVQVLVGKGFDPVTWQPTPRQLAQLAQARLYVRAGLPFEKGWMPRFRRINPSMKVLDMRQGIDPIHLAHGETDPHVWTDPRLVMRHAARLRDALIALDPDNRARYEKGYQELVGRLQALDRELSRKLAPLKGKAFLVFHPAWSYFARRYGLRQLAVEREGKEPSARALARLIDEARRLGIHTLIVQPQFNSAVARVVADALDARVVKVDPLDEDYFGSLRRLADLLVQASS